MDFRGRKHAKQLEELRQTCRFFKEEAERISEAGRALEQQRNRAVRRLQLADAELDAARRKCDRLAQVVVEQEALINALERSDAGEQL